jgi:glycine/D-amino acid oxidase-like deaminating enzyme
VNVVVVGTGVVGAAVGYYLAEAGDRVVLVDRGDVGSGTSSRCEGDVLAVDKEPGYDADLTLASLRLLRELAERVGGFEYRQPGSYLVLGGDDEVELAEAWVNRHRAAGLALAFLDAAAVRRELPDIGPDGRARPGRPRADTRAGAGNHDPGRTRFGREAGRRHAS